MDDYETWKKKRTERLAAEHNVRLKKEEEQEEQRKQRQKQLDTIVKDAVAQVFETFRHHQPSICGHQYSGAFGIHPRHLVTWYFFSTDFELRRAESNGLTKEIDTCTRLQLQQLEYPSEGVAEMMVSFASEEEIARFQRETGLSRYDFFK